MNNVVNLKAPFVDEDGFPLHGGRVRFVSDDTSGEEILVYGSDGTPLQNPLPLNELGVWSVQPFVEDGISYRMLVEQDTGVPNIPPETGNAWRVIDEIVVKSPSFDVEYEGAAVVDSLAELRLANPSLGTCIVRGYTSASDQCPIRIFQWQESLLAENYGTHVRSSVAGQESAGTWVCEPSGNLDARWFGLETGTDTDQSQALSLAFAAYPNVTLYLPKGNIYVDTSVSLGSVIMEKGCNIRTNNTDGVSLIIERLDNRGGKFWAHNSSNTAYRAVPVLKGELRTSWFGGSLNEFLTERALQDIETIVFDVFTAGGASVTISKKFVDILGSASIPNTITLSDCIVNRIDDGQISATEFHIARTNATLTIDKDGVRIGKPNYSVDVSPEQVEFTSDFGGTEKSSSLSASSLSFIGSVGSLEVNASHVKAVGGGSTATLNGLSLAIVTEDSETIVDAEKIQTTLSIAKAHKDDFDRSYTHPTQSELIITDEQFSGGDFILVVAGLNENGYGEVKIGAQNIVGRVVKVACVQRNPNLSVATNVNIYWTENGEDVTICCLNAGASAYIVATETGWVLDLGRV